MPTRRRIRSFSPAVTVVEGPPTGGGTGNVVWGPDFGEGAGSDGKTFNVGVQQKNLDTLALSNTDLIGTLLTMPSLAMSNTDLIGVNQDLDDVALSNTDLIGANLTMPSLALENTDLVGVNLTMPEVANSNTDLIGNHLSGTILAAPFWQSSSTNSGTATSSGTLTITPPSGIQNGDLMVAFITNSGAGSAVTSAPAGWTLQVTNTTSASPSLWCYTKVAASEAGSYAWGLSATAVLNYVGGIHLIRGVHASTPINTTGQSGASATNPVTANITTSVVNCMIIHGVAQTSAATAYTFTPPANYVERWDLSGGTVAPVSETSANRVQAATGSAGAQTFTSTAIVASQYATISIAIAPGEITIAS